MSWGTKRTGTREEVLAQLTLDYDGTLKNYPEDTNEGKDVVALFTRAFETLAALDLSPSTYYEAELVEVSVNGSHSWSGDKEHPNSATASFNVTRMQKKQA